VDLIYKGHSELNGRKHADFAILSMGRNTNVLVKFVWATSRRQSEPWHSLTGGPPSEIKSNTTSVYSEIQFLIGVVYKDQRRMDSREGGENCIMRSFIICTLHQIQLEL
jgi:hypothetical protein